MRPIKNSKHRLGYLSPWQNFCTSFLPPGLLLTPSGGLLLGPDKTPLLPTHQYAALFALPSQLRVAGDSLESSFKTKRHIRSSSCFVCKVLSCISFETRVLAVRLFGPLSLCIRVSTSLGRLCSWLSVRFILFVHRTISRVAVKHVQLCCGGCRCGDVAVGIGIVSGCVVGTKSTNHQKSAEASHGRCSVACVIH